MRLNSLKGSKKGVFMKKKILLIIPAYNEQDNILNTYEKIKKYDGENIYDVIVINDGSKDLTSEICKKNNIPTINLIQNLGIGGAVQTGYKYAFANDYDIAIQFDGDGQHDVRFVKDIIKPIIDNNADFVIGSRFIEKKSSEFKSTFSRRIGINIISIFTKVVGGKRIYDATSGFRACNKKIIKMFNNDYPLEYPEPITNTKLLKMGYRVEEVPVSMNERENGRSSIHSWKNVYYMINVIFSIIIVGIRRYDDVN